jgi:hypothetical protein
LFDIYHLMLTLNDLEMSTMILCSPMITGKTLIMEMQGGVLRQTNIKVVMWLVAEGSILA